MAEVVEFHRSMAQKFLFHVCSTFFGVCVGGELVNIIVTEECLAHKSETFNNI